MKDGTININVGAGVCDLKIEHNTVTVDGNLVVKGKVSAYSVSAGDIKATASENGGGTISADTSITTQGVSLATHKHSGVTSGGSNTGKPL